MSHWKAKCLAAAAALALLSACSAPNKAEKDQSAAEIQADNVQLGAAFLAQNAKQEGVTVLPSGLQYKILKSGPEGLQKPTIRDGVRVHYEGTFPDGRVFDSSIQRGEPAEFGVAGVIPGWTEAMQLMRPGDQWMLYVPSDLAYGPSGAGADIPPNQVLVFKVEMLAVLTADGKEIKAPG